MKKEKRSAHIEGSCTECRSKSELKGIPAENVYARKGWYCILISGVFVERSVRSQTMVEQRRTHRLWSSRRETHEHGQRRRDCVKRCRFQRGSLNHLKDNLWKTQHKGSRIREARLRERETKREFSSLVTSFGVVKRAYWHGVTAIACKGRAASANRTELFLEEYWRD
jgi:hypothetical protein